MLSKRYFACGCSLMLMLGCSEELYFIPGTGSLPDCNEAPIADLSNTLWFDHGTVTIRREGCAGAMPNDEFQSCALNWAFTQDGNEVSIVGR